MSVRDMWRRRARPGQTASGKDRAQFQWVYEPVEGGDNSVFALEDRGKGSAQYAFIAESPAVSMAAPDDPGDVPDTGHQADPELKRPEPFATAIAATTPADPRTAYLRHNLDIALDRWGERGETAPPGLVRAGLESLAKGAYFSPDQQTLLLRSALRNQQGMLTALQVQDDAERVGLVLAEELATPNREVTPEVVLDLKERDASSAEWFGPLLVELRLLAANPDIRIRRNAVDALWRLEASRPPPRPAEQTGHDRRARRHALIAAAALLAVVSLLAARTVLGSSPRMVYVPPGTYALSDVGRETYEVSAGGISIDKYEVTDRQYERCAAAGECTPRADTGAGGVAESQDARTDLLPATGLTLAQAEQYCSAQGMRLPTAGEWAVAAGATPATGVPLAYPWGQGQAVQLANTAEAQIGGPLEVGSYSPAGDSPTGASDMAGNVAEWTSTTRDGGASYVVKGGSFRDEATSALISAEDTAPPDTAAGWIGFRCLRPGGSRFSAPLW